MCVRFQNGGPKCKAPPEACQCPESSVPDSVNVRASGNSGTTVVDVAVQTDISGLTNAFTVAVQCSCSGSAGCQHQYQSFYSSDRHNNQALWDIDPQVVFSGLDQTAAAAAAAAATSTVAAAQSTFPPFSHAYMVPNGSNFLGENSGGGGGGGGGGGDEGSSGNFIFGDIVFDDDSPLLDYSL